MPIKTAINWLRRFIKYRVLHVDDTPHRIALAMGISLFVTWMPAIGVQMLLVVLLCTLFGANKVVGIPFVWISNPLTAVPIYAPNYFLGRWILGSEAKDVDWSAAIRAGEGNWFEQFVGRFQNWWSLTIDVFWPLWVGSLVVGAALGVATYIFVYYFVIYYRKKRPHLKLKLPFHLLRRQAKEASEGPAAGAVDEAEGPS